MVKANVGKVTVGDSSITLVLTDEMMRRFQGGDVISISNDGNNVNVKIQTNTDLACCMSKRADKPDLKDLVISETQKAISESVSKPAWGRTVPASIKKGTSPAKAPLKSSKKSPAKVSFKEEVRGFHASPATVKEGKEKLAKKTPTPVPDPLVKVEARLRKVGVFKDGDDLKSCLEDLNDDLLKHVQLQSYLWKEYVIANRVNGYEGSADRREDSIRKDENHKPSQQKKILAFAKVLGSGDAAKDLRQPATESHVLAHVETEEAEEGPEYSASETQVSSKGQTEQVEASLEREDSTCKDTPVARTPPVQEGSDSPSNSRTTSNSNERNPYGSQTWISVEGRGRGNNTGRGRKSKTRS